MGCTSPQSRPLHTTEGRFFGFRKVKRRKTGRGNTVRAPDFIGPRKEFEVFSGCPNSGVPPRPRFPFSRCRRFRQLPYRFLPVLPVLDDKPECPQALRRLAHDPVLGPVHALLSRIARILRFGRFAADRLRAASAVRKPRLALVGVEVGPRARTCVVKNPGIYTRPLTKLDSLT